MTEKSETRILVEGPAWGDAEFYGRWLLAAAKANELLQQAKSGSSDFSAIIADLESMLGFRLDFGITATVFVSQFADKKFHTFIIGAGTFDGLNHLFEFVLMAEMEFFILTGDRYQMTVPPDVDIDRVILAHRKLAETEDVNWIHPERLVAGISCARAKKYQRLLSDINQDERLANRRALLFLD